MARVWEVVKQITRRAVPRLASFLDTSPLVATRTSKQQLTCSHLAEEVQTETHFPLPSLDLDPDYLPILDESTVKYLAN